MSGRIFGDRRSRLCLWRREESTLAEGRRKAGLARGMEHHEESKPRGVQILGGEWRALEAWAIRKGVLWVVWKW